MDNLGKMTNTRLIKSISILVAVVLVAGMYIFPDSIIVVALINLFSLFFFCNNVRTLQHRLMSPFILIAASLYVFHSGHLWLALFNINPKSFLLSFEWYMAPNIEYIIQTYRMITTLLIIFMVVGLMAIKPISGDDQAIKHYKTTKLFSLIFHGLYILAMYFELLRAYNVAALGYGGGYHYGSVFAQYISRTVEILLLMLLYVYRNNPNKFRYYLALDIIKILFVMFFVGNRGTSAINLLITLFIVYNYSYISYNTRRLRIILISAGVFIFVALPFISATRGERENMNVREFLSSTSPVEAFLEEFGGTVYNVFLSQDYVYNIGSAHGIQILGTTLSIFPGSTMIFGDIITSNISIGNQLNIYNNREGLGGSMISQLYFNFGESIMLYLSIALIAYIVAIMSNSLMKNNGLYKTLFLLSVFSGFMTFVRGEWYDVVTQTKVSVYIIILLMLFKSKIIVNK